LKVIEDHRQLVQVVIEAGRLIGHLVQLAREHLEPKIASQDLGPEHARLLATGVEPQGARPTTATVWSSKDAKHPLIIAPPPPILVDLDVGLIPQNL
jgi:hypothetical protein